MLQQVESGKCIHLAQHVTKGSSRDNEPSVSINPEWIVTMWAHVRIRVRRNVISTDHHR